MSAPKCSNQLVTLTICGSCRLELAKDRMTRSNCNDSRCGQSTLKLHIDSDKLSEKVEMEDQMKQGCK
jgi:hypothetical protein